MRDAGPAARAARIRAACAAALRAHRGRPRRRSPPETACTEIYGGPDVVTIERNSPRRAVDVELTRANGCEIDRFEKFAPVLEELYPDYKPGSALSP